MNKNIKDIYGLTPSQEGVYAQYFQNADTKTYQLQSLCKIGKGTDLKLLEKSIYLLSLRHQVLKTAFTVLKSTGAIKQVILENRKPKFSVLSQDKPFTQNVLDKIAKDDINEHLDLQNDSLFKVTVVDFADERFMIIHTHHIIIDGWCLPVIINDLQKYYGELSKGISVEELSDKINNEAALSTPYSQYVNWIKSQDKDEISKYWQNLLAENSVSHIFGKEKKDNAKNGDIATFKTPLGNELSKNIELFAKNSKISLNTVFEGAFSIALQKFSNSDDIVYDKVISGRSIPLKNIENTVGLFINTVPVRIKSDENTAFSDLLNETQKQTIDANKYGVLSLADVYKTCDIESKSIDAFFVFENYYTGDVSDISKGALSLEPIAFNEQTEFNLTVTVLSENDEYTVRASYDTEMYSESEISRFVQGYISILTHSLDNKKLIKDINIAEQDIELIKEFNKTEHTYDIEETETLYSLFEKVSEERIDKVCIKANGEEITFKDFKAYAERIDNRIRSITEEKSVIAVICERSFEMYGAVYGIIRGGNAYLPIDPDYPQSRIDYILENSKAKAVVTQSKFSHLVKNIPCIDATELLSLKETTKTECRALPDDTAYVIYTSGSTGNPKGARISHKSAINRILWMNDSYPLENDDVILQKTPYTFDVSVWELFWWGIVGGTLCASKPGEHFLPAKILNETEKNRVTHLHFVPSVFDLFLTYLENNREEEKKFNSVKYVFLSGEALTENHIKRFYNIFDCNKVQLHNLYGPTECAVDVSYYACKPTDTDPVPIGKPIYNTQLYIVDKYLNQTPIGVIGELCIAGDNVGQGYLNNEELTKERFIDNPFGKGKLYKTGDLAYWRNDGNICYVGRTDSQIKLNGQRIELSEIEKVISEYSSAVSAAVMIKQNNGQDFIVAYCCGKNLNTNEMKIFCKNRLPHYMVPSAFVIMDELPLNASGKLDRKRLNTVDVIFEADSAKEPPINESEEAICQLFQKQLYVDFVGRNDDFFSLGGTSLDMISVLSENVLESISAAEFIANPTPERLAKILEDNNAEESGLYALRKAENSAKVLILVPYAGGDASAFAALTKALERIAPELSLYYVDYLRSQNECEKAAEKIAEIGKKKEICIYSHCAGSAVALNIINILEAKGVELSHYISGGFIPLQTAGKINSWNIVSDKRIKKTLINAGAPIEKFNDNQSYNMIEKFRKDTDFMTEYFYNKPKKINVLTTAVMSKTDPFTKNYKKAEKLWGRMADNFDRVHFIETDSHYFQTESSEALAEIIAETISK